MAAQVIAQILGVDFLPDGIPRCLFQQHENQRHAHIFAVECLTEIGGSGVVVHGHADFVHPGQGMEHAHLLFGQLHFFSGQHIAVLQPLILPGVVKPLPLNPGHVQNVQLGQGIFQGGDLLIGNVQLLENIKPHKARQLQLLGGNQHKFDAGIAAHGLNERVDGAAVFQVAAEADGQVIQVSHLPGDGQQVCQGLGGVVVHSVTGVDDRDACIAGGNIGRAGHGMANGHNVSVAAENLGGVRHALAFGGGGGAGLGEANHIAAQLQHGRLKAEAGAGGRLKKQGSQLLVLAGIPVVFGVGNDVFGSDNEAVDFRYGQIQNAD